MDRFYWFVLGALAVWRVTHALTLENGPGGLFVEMRRALGRFAWGRALDCFLCTSVWIAAPFGALIGSTLVERSVLWLALSGAACILERVSTPADASTPAIYWEDEENEDVLLRKRAN